MTLDLEAIKARAERNATLHRAAAHGGPLPAHIQDRLDLIAELSAARAVVEAANKPGYRGAPMLPGSRPNQPIYSLDTVMVAKDWLDGLRAALADYEKVGK
jgi:hypothetical protein